MGWCKLGGTDGAKHVSDLIMYNTSLVSLDVRGNNFGNSGAIHIAQSLKTHENVNFKELDMGYNEIKDDGACALAQVTYNQFISN